MGGQGPGPGAGGPMSGIGSKRPRPQTDYDDYRQGYGRGGGPPPAQQLHGRGTGRGRGFDPRRGREDDYRGASLGRGNGHPHLMGHRERERDGRAISGGPSDKFYFMGVDLESVPVNEVARSFVLPRTVI